MTAALEAEGLGRRYRTTWGLRDCTLTVPEGTVTGLVGPNGAGKSTLLRLAAGLSRPTVGTVSVFGSVVRPNGTDHLDRVGYLDQFHPLFRYFRVAEMLAFGRKLNARWDDVSARKWLEDLGIPLDRRVGRLSGGQQAQVALTLCMAKRPDLLLLDEPVASLDPLARKRLLQALMGTVADRGTTVFLSSHIISELEPVCNYLIVLSESRVQIAGSIDDLLAGHRLLIGPQRDQPPPGVEVIATNQTSRQTTFLVRGDSPALGSEWQSIQPDLEEVVIAYLSNPDAHDASTLGRGAGYDPKGGAT
jgi:ABC-2 type transport system ATP-binding protein